MEAIRGALGAISWRLGIECLLRMLTRSLYAGLGVAALLVLAERLLSLGTSAAPLALGPVLVACLVAAGIGLAKWPSLFAAALTADARLGLDERLSTALAAGGGPMADLVRADAARCARAIDPRQRFPVVLPRSARGLLLLLVMLAIALLVPPMDLFGWGVARRARAAETANIRDSARAVQNAFGALRERARRQGLGGSAEALDQANQAVSPFAHSGGDAQRAQSAAAKASGIFRAAEGANDEARKAMAGNREEIERLLRERDLLMRAEGVVEQWRRDLTAGRGGLAPGAAPGQGNEKETQGGQPGNFVSGREPIPPPPEIATLGKRLLDARPGADTAMARQDVPWQYRAVVRNYFSPDKE